MLRSRDGVEVFTYRWGLCRMIISFLIIQQTLRDLGCVDIHLSQLPVLFYLGAIIIKLEN